MKEESLALLCQNLFAFSLEKFFSRLRASIARDDN
jgi:hypothetical protein